MQDLVHQPYTTSSPIEVTWPLAQAASVQGFYSHQKFLRKARVRLEFGHGNWESNLTHDSFHWFAEICLGDDFLWRHDEFNGPFCNLFWISHSFTKNRLVQWNGSQFCVVKETTHGFSIKWKVFFHLKRHIYLDKTGYHWDHHFEEPTKTSLERTHHLSALPTLPHTIPSFADRCMSLGLPIFWQCWTVQNDGWKELSLGYPEVTHRVVQVDGLHPKWSVLHQKLPYWFQNFFAEWWTMFFLDPNLIL